MLHLLNPLNPSPPQRKLGLSPSRGSTPVWSTCLVVTCYPCRDQLRAEEQSENRKSKSVALPTLQGESETQLEQGRDFRMLYILLVPMVPRTLNTQQTKEIH